jgi:hypothetical protein
MLSYPVADARRIPPMYAYFPVPAGWTSDPPHQMRRIERVARMS